MPSIRVKAPAKLNLYLAITGRRTDGYHDLCTLFQRISLADKLVIRTFPKHMSRRRAPFRLVIKGKRVPAGKSNLIWKVYEFVQRKFPHLPPIEVELTKCIPVAAGLGGGSSDAGTFLYVLNKICELALSPKQLANLGVQIGADVPFFTQNYACAIGRGRGEKLEEIRTMRRLWFTIVSFRKGLSTKQIYKKYDLKKRGQTSLTKAYRDVTITAKLLGCKDLTQYRTLLRNDLQPVCIQSKPAVKRVLNFLYSNGALAASVTGSGPTCFAIMQSQRASEKLSRAVRRRFALQTYTAHT